MITAAQLRAARALLGIDQRDLAELCGLSLPTIQRMEASDGVIRCNVDSLMKLVGRARRRRNSTPSRRSIRFRAGGRGVRLKSGTRAGAYPQRTAQDANPRMAGN
jgi:DNA-binding XRE family transcriptional regulator